MFEFQISTFLHMEGEVKIDISARNEICRPQGGPPTASPAKRVAVGKEEQRPERALTYKISRSKRYKACSDVGNVDKKDTLSK